MRNIALALTFTFLASGAAVGEARAAGAWTPSWTTANYGLEQEAVLPQDQTTNTTLRQTIRVTVGGERIRVVLSNLNGDGPLRIGAVHIALAGPPGSVAIDRSTDHEVRFSGRSGVVIPAGKTATSDALAMRAAPLARLSISIHMKSAPAQSTGHLRSLSRSWTASGDQTAKSFLVGAMGIDHWYYLAAVEVEKAGMPVIVALGDSITDGSLSTLNANERWPDRLAERLAATPGEERWAVANKGIAGNRLLAYGRGPSALDRFEHDVLEVKGARTVVLLEGVNDLGQFAKTSQDAAEHRAMTAKIIAAYEAMIDRAHARGLRVVGATLTPFWDSDYEPSSLGEDDRQSINAWIRSSGRFDAVIDWDALMRDPSDPRRLNPAYDSGDHLHPSSAGYRAMADAIRIEDLTQ